MERETIQERWLITFDETQAIAIQNSKWCSVWLNETIAISYASTELCKPKEFLTQHGNQPLYKYFTDVRHNFSLKRKTTACLLTQRFYSWHSFLRTPSLRGSRQERPYQKKWFNFELIINDDSLSSITTKK